jgi:pimeloyl-ACP methyl ester carboxylesterase
MPYREAFYSAQDGLRLFYRDYGDPLSCATPVLCLAGLNRNSADFADLAEALAAERRVLCPDLRGRGRSAFDPNPANYTAPVYLGDLFHLLTVTGCHRVIVIGTSLGGLLAMAMGTVMATTLAGVVLNDIGPDIGPSGLARIQDYTGGNTSAMTEAQATALAKERFSSALPDLSEEEWAAETKRCFALGDDGLYRGNCDPAIAAALARQTQMQIDLWPYFHSLRKTPTLAIRGALSDILSNETFMRMAAENPALSCLTVANRGHTPLLNEPECRPAIAAFLERHGHAH